MAKKFYPAVVERAARGLIGVWLPDFPDCVAAGATQEEAIQKAETELAHLVDGIFERDEELPAGTPMEEIEAQSEPRFLAFVLIGVEPPDPSERVNIYLPRSLIARADKRAAELGVSRSSFFGLAVSNMLGSFRPGYVAGSTTLSKAKQLRGKSKGRRKSSPKKE